MYQQLSMPSAQVVPLSHTNSEVEHFVSIKEIEKGN